MPPRTISPTSRPPSETPRRSRSLPANYIPIKQEPTEEQIRRRAYELFLARGAQPGSAEADWRQAEQELRARATLFGKP